MSLSARICLVSGIALLSLLSLTVRAEDAKPKYQVVDSLKLPGSTKWDYLTFDAIGKRLFVTRGDSVDVLNMETNKVLGTIAHLNGAHGVALAPAVNKGFVTEGKANQVTVFDLATLKVTGTVATGNKPDAVVYDDATSRIFVADGESDDLTVVDAKTEKVIGKIPLGGGPEFAAVDGNGMLYVNLEDKSQIVAVDTKQMKALAHYDLSPSCEKPAGIAIDKTRNYLFSACASKTMVVVDAATGHIIDTLPIGEHSDAAAYDPGTGLAFSSNGNDGTLTVVGLGKDGHYQVVQTVQTKISARTMAIDPTTHRIYLSASETEGFDSVSADHPEARPHVIPDTFSIITVDQLQ